MISARPPMWFTVVSVLAFLLLPAPSLQAFQAESKPRQSEISYAFTAQRERDK